MTDEETGKPLSIAGATLWTLAALFLFTLLLDLTEASRAGAVFDLVSRTACQVLAYSTVFFVLLRLHEPHTSIRYVLGLRAPTLIAIVCAVALGVLLSFPATWLSDVVERRFPPPPEEQEAFERILAMPSLGKKVALVVSLALVQPAFDELFFRGAIFTPLTRTRSVREVVIVVAALETLGSLNPRAMAMMLVTTLIFSWLRAVTNSVIPSVLARVSYVGMAVVPLVLGREMPKLPPLGVVGCVVGAALVLYGLHVHTRARA